MLSEQQITEYISQELKDSQKTKEEKVEGIISFCLDYLSQDTKEGWEKKRAKTLLLLALTENEWKETKREMFKGYINKTIINKMKF